MTNPLELVEGGHYLIAGGGCYGTDYVRQLLRARAAGAISFARLTVIDHDPSCAVGRAIEAQSWPEDVRLHVADWIEFVDDWWPYRDALSSGGAHWVPTPLAPHIVFLWLLRLSAALGRPFEGAPWPAPPPRLPFAEALSSGSLALSHAPGLCPVHCIEPAKCPLTRGPRTWEMRETVHALLPSVPDATAIGVVRCQHHAFGVGTISFGELTTELSDSLAAARRGASALAFATVSSCHGLADFARRREPPAR